MPRGHFGYAANGDLIHAEGIAEAVFAPSNTNRLYMMYRGRMYRSDNFGATWSYLSNFSTATSEANTSPTKTYGPKIAVKPDNADVLYVGTPANGLRFSNDAGSTWNTVSTGDVPNPSGIEGYCIVFDKTNSSRVWIGSFGNGWHVSTSSASGTGFSPMTGDPTTFRTAKCDQNGNLWICYPGTNESLTKWNGSSWTNQEFHSNDANRGRAQCVAINPNDANNIIVIIDSGHLSATISGGGGRANWTGINFTQHSLSGTGIPWLQYTAPGTNQYMTIGDCDWCPISNRVYVSAGVGVWYTTDFNGGSHTWQQQSAGIEQLVVNQIMSRTDGNKIVACWDRAVFRVDGTNYPRDWGTDHNVEISHGWSVDCAPDNEDFIVVLNNNFGQEHSGYSRNGGLTWTKFATFPSFMSNGWIGGQIAAGSTTNLVWIPGNASGNARPHYTTNGGSTWTIWNTPSGVPSTGDIGLGFAFFLNRKALCKDWVSGLFYLYLHATDGDTSYAGVYTSPTGATWTKVNSGRLANGAFNFKIAAVPGNEGHLFRTAGVVGGSISGQFQRSTDGGANWSSISNMAEVWAFGFGAVAGGASYPTLYAFGWNGGRTPGIWRTINADRATPTWTRVGPDAFPADRVDLITWVTGDKADSNRCYVGMRGSGAVQFG